MMKNKIVMGLVVFSLFLPVMNSTAEASIIEEDIVPIEGIEHPVGRVTDDVWVVPPGEEVIIVPQIEEDVFPQIEEDIVPIEGIEHPVGIIGVRSAKTIQIAPMKASIQVKVETINGTEELSIKKGISGQLSLRSKKATAVTNENLIAQENKLFIDTIEGKQEIKILPNSASEIAIESVIQTVKEIELKEDAAKPVYSVKGTKQARILFIFPVTLEIETKIDAKKGNIISVKKPWWSFLAW